jgi:hypothetical protein
MTKKAYSAILEKSFSQKKGARWHARPNFFARSHKPGERAALANLNTRPLSDKLYAFIAVLRFKDFGR